METHTSDQSLQQALQPANSPASLLHDLGVGRFTKRHAQMEISATVARSVQRRQR